MSSLLQRLETVTKAAKEALFHVCEEWGLSKKDREAMTMMEIAEWCTQGNLHQMADLAAALAPNYPDRGWTGAPMWAKYLETETASEAGQRLAVAARLEMYASVDPEGASLIRGEIESWRQRSMNQAETIGKLQEAVKKARGLAAAPRT